MSRKRKEQRPPAKSKCRDCGQETVVARFLYFKAAPPRCFVCGGLLDYQGSMRGSRSRRQ